MPVNDAPPPPAETPEPAAAALLGKVRRLMAVSLLFTALALGAVFAIIGYRIYTGADARPPADATANLPRGARVAATAIGDGRLVVTIEGEGGVELRMFDLETLQPRGSLRFMPAP